MIQLNIYRCNYCKEPVQPGRVVAIYSDGEKVVIEHWCCKDHIISTRYLLHMPALNKLRLKFPYKADPPPLSPAAIDELCAMMAVDMASVETAEDFEWWCEQDSKRA